MFHGTHDRLGQVPKTAAQVTEEVRATEAGCKRPKRRGMFRMPFFGRLNWWHPCDFGTGSGPSVDWLTSIQLACMQRKGLLDCGKREELQDPKHLKTEPGRAGMKLKKKVKPPRRRGVRKPEEEATFIYDPMAPGPGLSIPARIPATKLSPTSRTFEGQIAFGRGDAAVLQRKKELIVESAGSGMISKPATGMRTVTGSGFISR